MPSYLVFERTEQTAAGVDTGRTAHDGELLTYRCVGGVIAPDAVTAATTGMRAVKRIGAFAAVEAEFFDFGAEPVQQAAQPFVLGAGPQSGTD